MFVAAAMLPFELQQRVLRISIPGDGCCLSVETGICVKSRGTGKLLCGPWHDSGCVAPLEERLVFLLISECVHNQLLETRWSISG